MAIFTSHSPSKVMFMYTHWTEKRGFFFNFFSPKAQTVGGLSFQGEANRDAVGRSRAEDIKPGLNERIKTRSYGRAATSECHFSPRPARLPPASCPFPEWPVLSFIAGSRCDRLALLLLVI